jgi:PAS domain S-box-containing protein
MRKIDVWGNRSESKGIIMSLYEKIDEFRQRLSQYSVDSAEGEQLLEELSAALEELTVMQEELEVQNEEIESSRAEAVQQSQRYQELFEFAPDAYAVTDEVFTILEANRATVELLRVKPSFVLGKLLVTFICEQDRSSFRLIVSQITETTDFEICMQPRGVAPIVASIRVAPMFDPNGSKRGYRWILRDITSEKQMRAAVQDSERRFRNIFHTASIGVALIDSQGRIVEANQALTRFLGTDPIKDQHDRIYHYIQPEDRQNFEAQVQMVLEEKCPVARGQIRFNGNSDELLWGTTGLSLMRYKPEEQSLLLLMLEDITRQKEALDEREEMQRRIIDSIEAERVHLARELHDNAMQDLYVILYELEGADNIVSDPVATERLQNLKEMLLLVINTLRATVGELRPPTLLRYGVESAVKSYLETIQPLYPQMNFELKSNINRRDLPERLAVTFYRAVQESMHNVIRHSEADTAVITLNLEEDRLTARIEDNGVGFSVPDSLMELMRDGHYGLAGLQERAKALDGELSISSILGQGTVVEMSAPVKPV